MKLHHVIEAQQFDPATLAELFQVTEEMEGVVADGGVLDYQKRVMATLFYEPSTRTRFSFETAMHRLGGRVISTENAAEFSSVAKGETLEDTIRIMNAYSDVIVLRHQEVGAAKRAAAVSRIPVIMRGTAWASTRRRRCSTSTRSARRLAPSRACGSPWSVTWRRAAPSGRWPTS